MAKIAIAAEKQLDYKTVLKKKRESAIINVADAISLATCETASALNVAAIVTATQTGSTARMVAKYKSEAPVIAVTPDEKVARSLALSFGVYAIVAPKVESTDALIVESVKKAKEYKFVKDGDLVVVAAGIQVQLAGSTNMLKVHVVGSEK
jgi:pyruvate kinase